MRETELDQLTLAWEQWAAEPERAGRKLGRARLHLIFLLIRFGGLRLGEALSLNLQRDLDQDTGMLRVTGAFARHVLLPLHCMAALRRILSLHEAKDPQFLTLDPGFCRRTFYSIAKTLGIDASLAGPRALRYLRGQELLSFHAPLKFVQDYLGLVRPYQIDSFLKFTGTSETTPTANSFAGLITATESGMRSGLIKIKTFSGLFLNALCDMRTFMQLEPRPGLVASARIAREHIVLAKKVAPFANCIPGRLKSFYPDPVESFAVVELCDKSLLRADIETGQLVGLEPDAGIMAMFPARAVQLCLA